MAPFCHNSEKQKKYVHFFSCVQRLIALSTEPQWAMAAGENAEH